MDEAGEDYDYARKRKPGRLYISKRFQFKPTDPVMRNAHRVFPSDAMPVLVKEHDEIILRTTHKGVQQVKAKFVEDDRRILTLWFQRWSVTKGWPIGEQVSFVGDEITRLIEFLNSIARVHIPNEQKFNVDFGKLVHVPDDAARMALEDNPAMVAEFARNQITTEDIVALGYRRQQLEQFGEMLGNEGLRESDWQDFFERNPWIFGYGLSYVFTTGLDGEALQQTIRGSSLFQHGKRPDGVLKTRARISALCLVEIKKHSTGLLKPSSYRPGTWVPSAELSGAVAQAQENVRVALDEIGHHHRRTDSSGAPTGEELLAVQPRSFLIVGSLAEFETERGPNIERYRSFEDYRRNLRQPEIITFDELYERARFIVDSADHRVAPASDPVVEEDDEIPF